jgi:dihydropteroate synthase
MTSSGDKGTVFSDSSLLHCGDKVISLADPVTMGILNVTPDSFYDGGIHRSERECLKRVELMLGEGASIIDIGAVSSRPGAAAVSEEEELERLLPVVKAVRKSFPEAILSVDTYRAMVVRKSADLGAGMINDISGGSMDQAMFSTVSEYRLAYVLMHMQGDPSNMQVNPVYTDLVGELKAFFRHNLDRLQTFNIHHIAIDPGFGFGKTLDHNYQLLNHLHQFSEFKRPILAGISRKSMIHRLLSSTPNESLHATGALHAIALLKGASILRVHDVKEAMQVIQLLYKLKNTL